MFKRKGDIKSSSLYYAAYKKKKRKKALVYFHVLIDTWNYTLSIIRLYWKKSVIFGFDEVSRYESEFCLNGFREIIYGKQTMGLMQEHFRILILNFSLNFGKSV